VRKHLVAVVYTFLNNLKNTLNLDEVTIEKIQDNEKLDDIIENIEYFIDEEIIDALDINKNYSLKDKKGNHFFVHDSPLEYTVINDYLNLNNDSDHLKTLFYLISKVFHSYYKNEEKLQKDNFLISLNSTHQIKKSIEKIKDFEKILNGEEIAKNLIELDDYINGQYEMIDSLLNLIDEKFYMNRSYNTFEIIFNPK